MTTTKSARQKGKDLENYVADQIVFKGMDVKARRDGASGAGIREKGDIVTSLVVLGQNAGIECKNHATLHIPEWWKQTKKLETLGREPILAFKMYGEPMDETKVVIYLDTFLELVKKANEADGILVDQKDEGDPNKKRELKWAVANLKAAAGKVERLLSEE